MCTAQGGSEAEETVLDTGIVELGTGITEVFTCYGISWQVGHTILGVPFHADFSCDTRTREVIKSTRALFAGHTVASYPLWLLLCSPICCTSGRVRRCPWRKGMNLFSRQARICWAPFTAASKRKCTKPEIKKYKD